MNMKLKDMNKTKVLIAREGKSLRGFAKEIGMSHAYLSQILNEKRNPSPTIAYKIAKGLNRDIEDVFLIKVFDGNGHAFVENNR